MNERKQHQGGWVAQFVIVGVVLVFCLGSSLYFLRAQQDGDSAPTVPGNEETEVTQPTPSSTTQSEGESQEPAHESTNEGVREEATPAPTEEESQTIPGSATPRGTDAPDNTDTNLPATGPTETLTSLAAVTLLTLAVASYFQSRRDAYGQF